MKFSRMLNLNLLNHVLQKYASQNCVDHRRHRPGRGLSLRVSSRQGLEAHGIQRRSTRFHTDRIDHLHQDPHVTGRRFVQHHGDLTDSSSLVRIIQAVQPDEIYNLAAQTQVAARR